VRLPRCSIAALVFAVALIAADIALVQNLFIHSRAAMVSVRYGLLMANVLAIADYRLWSGRGTRRPFSWRVISSGPVGSPAAGRSQLAQQVNLSAVASLVV
jgi:hypothetical protein